MKKIVFILLAQCLCVGLFAQIWDFHEQLYYAQKGIAIAQNYVGWCYETGESVAKSYSDAYKWYRKSADQGNSDAQNNVGRCYEYGIGVEKNYSEAHRWYRKSADEGNSDGQNNVGYCYEYGKGVEKNYSEALRWYRKSAEQGNADAQNNVGLCYGYGKGVEKNYYVAFKWYMRAAEQGYDVAQDNVGIYYENGYGVSQNYSEAFKWYMKSAEQGNDIAQNDVGRCYEYGIGVDKNYYVAFKWYMKSAEQENAVAQRNVGICYQKGQGVKQDYHEAFRWYMYAAEQGQSMGQCCVGLCYVDGIGVEKNYSEAFKWFMKAAENGYAIAQYAVGLCYDEGYGISQSHSEAYKWYLKAAEQGNTDAKSKLQKMSETVVTQNNTAVAFNPSAPPSIDFVANSLQFVDANGNNAIDAEEKCTIRLQVTNSGKGDARNCVAKITSATIPGVTYKNVDIPQIKAGETKTVEIPLTANMQTQNGIAKFTIQIDEPNGFGTDAVSLSVNTRAFDAPMLRVVDYATVSADGSSVLAKKSAFDLQILLQNVEAGKAENVQVSIEVPENVFLMDTQNQKTFTSINGGDTKKITYSLIANNNYAGASIPVKVNVKEKHGKYAESRTIDLPLNQTLRNHNIVLEEKNGDGQKKDIQIASIGSDVDKNIPSSTVRNDRTFAVIIANENYNKEANVPYAVNDGNVFSEYCSTTLGIPTNNIHLVRNATLNDIRHEVNWITNVMDASGGKAKVLFYYAGHGIPDEKTRTAYLLPVDGYGSDVTTGYPLTTLYSALGESTSQSVTVFLDACFSGTKREGDMMASARGVAIKVNETSPVGNMVVFSAAQGDETAYPYTEQGHGLFTYYLLKKLQDTEGNVTLGDLSDYVIEQVKLQSVVINSKPQTPSVIPSPNMSDSWRSETLK